MSKFGCRVPNIRRIGPTRPWRGPGRRRPASDIADLRHDRRQLDLKARMMGETGERGMPQATIDSAKVRRAATRMRGCCGKRPGPFRRRRGRRSRIIDEAGDDLAVRSSATETAKIGIPCKKFECRRAGRYAIRGFCQRLRPRRFPPSKNNSRVERATIPRTGSFPRVCRRGHEIAGPLTETWRFSTSPKSRFSPRPPSSRRRSSHS